MGPPAPVAMAVDDVAQRLPGPIAHRAAQAPAAPVTRAGTPGVLPCTRSGLAMGPTTILRRDSSEAHTPVPEWETVGVPDARADMSAESQRPC
jgi:hypothetical protein